MRNRTRSVLISIFGMPIIAAAVTSTATLITARGLSKHYGRRDALVDLELGVEGGELVALVGAEIPVLPYIVPAGLALANAVAPLIEGHDAVLLGNHGVLTVGSNVREAYFRNVIIEEAAKTWLAARAAGTPHVLTPDEVHEVYHLEAEDYRRALLRGDVD